MCRLGRKQREELTPKRADYLTEGWEGIPWGRETGLNTRSCPQMARLSEIRAGRDKGKLLIEGRSTPYLHVRGRPTHRRFLDSQRNLRVFAVAMATVPSLQIESSGMVVALAFCLESFGNVVSTSGELHPMTQRL